jgi:glycosyltransferase 2 family protein
VFLLRSVPIEDVGQALGRAQIIPIALIVAFVMGSLITRAARWQIFFLPRRHVPFGPALGILAISYMTSTFLPFRAGELVRPVFLGLRQKIPVANAAATILLEKLFDFLAIGVMLGLLVLLTPLPAAAQVAGISIASVTLVGFGFVVALAAWRTPTLSLVGEIQRRLPNGLGKRLPLVRAAANFAEGTDSLREPRLWALLLGWTAVTWLCSLGSTLAGTLSLGVQPGLPALLFVIVLTSTGQAVPSSPGYVGVYHAAATLALTAFGVDPATAIGIALVTHAFSYGSLVIAGLIALWTGGYTFGDVLKGIKAGQSRPAVSPSAASADV